jgi:hypothetical protein
MIGDAPALVALLAAVVTAVVGRVVVGRLVLARMIRRGSARFTE